MPGNTDSYCERCGTRYVFQVETPRNRSLRRAMLLAKGLRNFVVTDGQSMSEAMALARRESDSREGIQLADAFQRTFNFCMICRQYACDACWNPAQTACLSCAPLAGGPPDMVLQPSEFGTGDPGLLFPDILDRNGEPLVGRKPGPASSDNGPAPDVVPDALAWPAIDLPAAATDAEADETGVHAGYETGGSSYAGPTERLGRTRTDEPPAPERRSRTPRRSDSLKAAQETAQASTDRDELIDTEVWLRRFTLGEATDTSSGASDARPAPVVEQAAGLPAETRTDGTSGQEIPVEAEGAARVGPALDQEAAAAPVVVRLPVETAAETEASVDVPVHSDAAAETEAPVETAAEAQTYAETPVAAAEAEAEPIAEVPVPIETAAETEPSVEVPVHSDAAAETEAPVETAAEAEAEPFAEVPVPVDATVETQAPIATPVTADEAQAAPFAEPRPARSRGRILRRLIFRGAAEQPDVAGPVVAGPWPRPTPWQIRPRLGNGWLSPTTPAAAGPVPEAVVEVGPGKQPAKEQLEAAATPEVPTPGLEPAPVQPVAEESIETEARAMAAEEPVQQLAATADEAPRAGAPETGPLEALPSPGLEIAAESGAVVPVVPEIEADTTAEAASDPEASALPARPPVPELSVAAEVVVAAADAPSEELQVGGPFERPLSEVEEAALARIAALGLVAPAQAEPTVEQSMADIAGAKADSASERTAGTTSNLRAGPVPSAPREGPAPARELPPGWPRLGAKWPSREAPGAPWSLAEPTTFTPAASAEQPQAYLSQVWQESSDAVLSRGSARVCQSCSLPLSTQARFCRRCGTRQG